MTPVSSVSPQSPAQAWSAGVPLDVALTLQARAISVFPVPLPRPGTSPGRAGDGKTPTIAWAPWQRERPTADQVASWFRTPHNLAIVTGAISGFVVVDADSDEARRWVAARLPRTPLQVKTPRGWHLYYRHPGTAIRNRARIRTDRGTLALDVRADGGYVIGPFSLHASGERYWPLCTCSSEDWDTPDAAVPTFDPNWIVPPPAHRPRIRATPSGDDLGRAKRYLARVPVPAIGQGSDDTVFRVSCRLVRTFGLNSSAAVDLLDAWAGGRPGWDRAWLESKVAHAERYGTEPVGGRDAIRA